MNSIQVCPIWEMTKLLRFTEVKTHRVYTGKSDEKLGKSKKSDKN